MKMIRQLTVLAAALLTTIAAWAQPAAPTAKENSLLWKISGRGLSQPSYLFGTIHMIPAQDFMLSDATKSALQSAGRVAFEIDTEDMSNPLALFGLMDKMMMANDTSLADLLTEEDYGVVKAHFEKQGMPMFLFERIKPMFLSVMASEDVSSFNMQGSGDIKSYELELTEMAKQQSKDIVGLETMEFQMSLFDSIPYSAQARMLMEAVRAEKDTTAEGSFDQMVQLCKNQDIVGMQSMMGKEGSAGSLGGYEDLLLLRRNRSWIPIMEQLMKEGPVFFAVGAGHLAGEEGVIALLRAAGYSVEAVRS